MHRFLNPFLKNSRSPNRHLQNMPIWVFFVTRVPPYYRAAKKAVRPTLYMFGVMVRKEKQHFLGSNEYFTLHFVTPFIHTKDVSSGCDTPFDKRNVAFQEVPTAKKKDSHKNVSFLQGGTPRTLELRSRKLFQNFV